MRNRVSCRCTPENGNTNQKQWQKQKQTNTPLLYELLLLYSMRAWPAPALHQDQMMTVCIVCHLPNEQCSSRRILQLLSRVIVHHHVHDVRETTVKSHNRKRNSQPNVTTVLLYDNMKCSQCVGVWCDRMNLVSSVQCIILYRVHSSMYCS